MRWTSLALGAALLAGCSQNKHESVWIITASPADDPITLTVVTHNFTDASVPDTFDPADWVVTDETLTSDAIFTAQFVELDGDETHGALLIIGASVYPGVEGEDGGWSFTWADFDNSEDNESHTSGYSFGTRSDGTVTTTITWLEDEKTKIASGTVSQSSDNTTIWTETDNFDPVATGIYPQIPAGSYLVDDLGYPVQNAPAADDCTTDPCTLQVSDTMSIDFAFTAVQTEYGDEDVFDAVDDAGQSYGI